MNTTATTSTAQSIMSMLPMIAILVFFMYFMVIRPQSKRAKDQKKLMDSLQNGDEIITVGGVLGKIEKISGDFVIISLSDNNTMTIQKNSIATIVPHGTIKSL